MKKTIIYILSVTFLFSCVSEEKYNNVISDLDDVNIELDETKTALNKLEEENVELSKRIDDILYNKPLLIKEIREMYKLKDYKAAMIKISEMNKRHSGSLENTRANLFKENIIDHETFTKAKDQRDLFYLETYVANFPKALHGKEAKRIITEIKRENEKSEYQKALNSKYPSTLKAFIENYPNRSDISKLKEMLITKEVEEIMSQSSTGSLPSFDKDYYSSSSSSSFSDVTVENSTSYLLILRYSGASTKKVEIPAGRTQTVTVKSGRYKISATANGLHYAGTESLNGDYSSKYYITTSRF